MASLQFVAQSIKVAWSILRISLSIRSFTSPLAFAEMLSFPVPQSASHSPALNAFIPLFGARGIALDVLILFFSYQRRMDVVGTVVLCMVPIAVADAIFTRKFGRTDTALVHAIGSCVIALLGGYITYCEMRAGSGIL